MTEFTPTCTIELEKYMYLEKAYEDYGERIEAIQEFLRSRAGDTVDDVLEEMRDDGLFNII